MYFSRNFSSHGRLADGTGIVVLIRYKCFDKFSINVIFYWILMHLQPAAAAGMRVEEVSAGQQTQLVCLLEVFHANCAAIVSGHTHCGEYWWDGRQR